MRQTLLISVAALALAAASATGALAQKQQGAPGASGMSAPAGTNAPSGNPSGASGPSTGAPGAAEHESSEQPSPGSKKGAQNRIPEKQKSTEKAPSKGDKEQKSTQQTPSKSEHLKQQGQATPEKSTKQGQTEQKSNMRQGENATGTKQGGAQMQGGTQTKTGERAMTSKNVSLTTQQKTEIRSKVLTSSAPRVDHVDFDIRVGTKVPRTVHIVPVPQTLVEIEPQWRGFLYFVRGDEIVIIDPNSLEIVAVVEV